MRAQIRVQNRLFLGFITLSLTGMGSLSLAAEAEDLAGLETITVDRLVEAVLVQNPLLPAMESAWEAARDRIEPAGSLDDPMLSSTLAPETLTDPGVDNGYNIQLSQRLPWPGKRGLRREAARHEAAAARQGIQTIRLELMAETKSAFADWYLVHAALRINATNQSLWQEFRTIAESLYATGRGTRQDILQAEVERELLEHRRIVLERQRSEVQARLNRLLNRAPAASMPPPADLPTFAPLPDIHKLYPTALANRSERRALQARIEANQAKVALTEREFYPDFQVMTGYNSLWDATEKRWTVGVAVNIPLDRSKRRAAESSARAQLMENRWKLEDLNVAILAAVEQAYARVEESRHVLELYQKRLLPLAEENLDTAKIDYQAGTGDFLTLVNTERNLFLTRLNYEQARADQYRNLAQLERVLGAQDNLPIEPGKETRP